MLPRALRLKARTTSGAFSPWAMRSTNVALIGLLALLLPSAPWGQEPGRATVDLDGKAQALRVWEPSPGAPRRDVQVLVVSGDLGWLGISATLPQHLREQGYRVVGLNAQGYMAAFTDGKGSHLQETQIPRDFDTIMEATNVDLHYPTHFVSVGVSEGTGLAVMAMGQPGASDLCRGVIGLAFPMKTALAWRWVDLLTEVSRKEPPEHEADTPDYLPALRVPIVVVHSLHDEYDAIDKVRAAFALAPEPKRFYQVDAPNHRFSHHEAEVMALVDSSIAWMDSLAAAAPGDRARRGMR